LLAFVASIVLATSTLVWLAPPAQALDVCQGDYTNRIDVHRLSILHNGKAYEVALCLLDDNYPITNHYIYAKLVFDDDGTTSLKNQLLNGQPVGDKIEIDYIKLRGNGGAVTLAVCDQTVTPDTDDGGGCNRGNFTNTGPCLGMRDIQNHGQAADVDGCLASNKNFSQTDKYLDPAGQTDYWADVSFRVQWSNGTNSNWITLGASGAGP
jgi:hypothetical protein